MEYKGVIILANRKKKIEASDVVTGRNIYTDNKGRTIYYRKRTQQGFVIRPGSERAFKGYSNRFVVALVAAIFFYALIYENVWIAAIIGAVVLAFMQYRWNMLLNTYTMIQNFEPEKHESTLELIKQMDQSAILLRIVLYLALAILILINAYLMYIENPGTKTILMFVASIGIAIFGVSMGGRYIYALTTKNK